jgi:hypothetical protein
MVAHHTNNGSTKPGGLAAAGLFSLVTWHWVTRLVNFANREGLREEDTDYLHTASDDAPFLAAQFERSHEHHKV